MRNNAAVMYAPHDIRIEERQMPAPGPKEVVVEIKAVGVCGSDIHYYEHGRIGSFIVTHPIILGHESSGVIVELGSEVTRHKVGERVAIEPGTPCSHCGECRAGRYNLCKDVRFFATPPYDGAFANYVLAHEDFAFELPDNLSDEAGALIEPLSVGIWACQKGQVRAGSRVLITGAGPIGLLAMQSAVAFGATEVIVTDINPHRLEVAKKYGATRVINVAEQPLNSMAIQADVLLECSGNQNSVIEGIKALRPAGTAVIVGMGPAEEVKVPMAFIQNNEIKLTGTFRYANTYPTAIALVAAGKINLDAMVTGRYKLDQAEEALQAAHKDPSSIKVVVMPS
ncbi:MAG: Alcohol dehydrogenase GroES domain protein [Chloroflexi bacterium]|jgi:L-iditol 2-dehydrogenase|nr:Alcohol dehydrogenase GroES domain protein [Chloroflexota bacterium]